MQNIIKEEVTTVAQVSATDSGTQTAANIIYFVAGLFDVILLFRFLLKVTGANPASGFVSMIYSFSQFLVWPFQGIFSPSVTAGAEVRAIFEPATLVAMLVYGILAWGLVKLMAILVGRSSEIS
jgi:hypothetical protein